MKLLLASVSWQSRRMTTAQYATSSLWLSGKVTSRHSSLTCYR